MKKWFKRANKKIVNWIKFDSPEEIQVYEALIKEELHLLTGIKDLEFAKLISAEPSSFLLYEGFKAWEQTIRKRIYTHDFDIIIGNKLIALEVKSSWTHSMPDYRLRRAIFLNKYYKTINFMELIKIRKWVWEIIKYY